MVLIEYYDIYKKNVDEKSHEWKVVPKYNPSSAADKKVCLRLYVNWKAFGMLL